MKFSIITPSFQSGDWLPFCVRSVADQGVELEHIVQDAGSTDDTHAFLANAEGVQTFTERDSGMYDAINRGIRRSKGEIIAYLNADEQYLPGALQAVQELFAAQPETDIIVSDYIVTNQQGEFLCRRFANRPYWAQLWYRFGFSTAGLFMRRKLFFEEDLWFDPQFRVISDALWYLSACQRKYRWQVLRRFTSIFTETGNNLAMRPEFQVETQLKHRMIPRWVRLLSPLLITHYRLQILRAARAYKGSLSFALYTKNLPLSRTEMRATEFGWNWPGRS